LIFVWLIMSALRSKDVHATATHQYQIQLEMRMCLREQPSSSNIIHVEFQ